MRIRLTLQRDCEFEVEGAEDELKRSFPHLFEGEALIDLSLSCGLDGEARDGEDHYEPLPAKLREQLDGLEECFRRTQQELATIFTKVETLAKISDRHEVQLDTFDGQTEAIESTMLLKLASLAKQTEDAGKKITSLESLPCVDCGHASLHITGFEQRCELLEDVTAKHADLIAALGKDVTEQKDSLRSHAGIDKDLDDAAQRIMKQNGLIAEVHPLDLEAH